METATTNKHQNTKQVSAVSQFFIDSTVREISINNIMNISKKDKNVRFHEPVIIRTNDDITPSTSSSAIDNDNGCCYHDDVEEYIGDDSLIWYTNEEIRNMEQDLQQTLERIVYDKSVTDDPRGLGRLLGSFTCC